MDVLAGSTPASMQLVNFDVVRGEALQSLGIFQSWKRKSDKMEEDIDGQDQGPDPTLPTAPGSDVYLLVYDKDQDPRRDSYCGFGNTT